jgi:hypothetical protein
MNRTNQRILKKCAEHDADKKVRRTRERKRKRNNEEKKLHRHSHQPTLSTRNQNVH